MSEIDVASYLPPTFTCPDDERVLLRAWYFFVLQPEYVRHSVISHFRVEASIRERLMVVPCLRQNSSKALSVTKVSTSFKLPNRNQFLNIGGLNIRIFAARFQEHGVSTYPARGTGTDIAAGLCTIRSLLNRAVNEAGVMRGLRTLSMPVATSSRRRVRLMRSSFLNARRDQPSLTLALIPEPQPESGRRAPSDSPFHFILSRGACPSLAQSGEG